MNDELDADVHGPHDHPVIATLAGCAVLVAGAILVPRMLPAQPQTTLIGAFVAAGFILWLIGFVVTTRLASLGWKAGSLAIVLGAGALAGVLTHRQYEAGGREDPSSFADMRFGPQGNLILAKGAASRGPISRLFAASVQADTNDRRVLETALGKFGAGNLNSPYLLTQNPQAMAHCGDLESLKTQVRAMAAKRAERADEIGRAIDDAQLSMSLKQAIRAIAVADTGANDPLLANQLAGMQATAELCALLAKRGWYNANGYFGFNSGGDMTRYKSLQAKRAALASEAEHLDQDAVARMKSAQQKVQAELS